MSIKHVRDYYLRVTADYVELKNTLDQLESEVNEETSKEALANIESIRQSAQKVQENYNRLNYIMYLLDMPQKGSKKSRWENQNKKRLDSIPEKDRMKYVQKENKMNLDEIKKYIKC